MDIVDPGWGGGGHTDARYILQGGGSRGPYLWVGYVGDKPPPQPCPGSILQSGHALTYWAPTLTAFIRNLDLPAHWGGIGGGGDGVGKGLYHVLE